MMGSSFKKALVRAELGVVVVVRTIEDLGLTVSFGKTEMAAFMANDVPEMSFRIRGGRSGDPCEVNLEISKISSGFEVDFLRSLSLPPF